MMLTRGDVAQLHQAMAALQSGRAAQAEAVVRAMGSTARQHPDALYIFASARRAQGDMAGARAGYEAALRIAPGNPPLWNAYGNHLHDMGLAGEGVEALRRAVALHPGYAEGWLNLAIVAIDAAAFEIAEEALGHSARLMPGDARIVSARGALDQARGRPEAAAESYRALLDANPADLRARHNLATALRAADRREEALAASEEAIARGLDVPQCPTLRAHLLAELGRFDEAVAQYRAVMDRYPDYLDAHETFARLMPQIGRADEAMAAYDRALEAAPDHLPLLLSAIGAAKDLGRAERALALIERAAPLLPERDRLAVVTMQMLDAAGRRGEAIDLGRRVAAAEPARPGIQTQMAQLLLAAGDVVTAEDHAAAAIAQRPADQKAWALRTVIWRLLGDEREEWLAGYERIATLIDIGTPDGWRHQSDFLADLRATLEQLHVTTAHPADQTLRGGTQTRGELFDRRSHAPIMALKKQLQLCVTDYLASLTRDADHPFLSRLGIGMDFVGSWSVRLWVQGRHVHHYHPRGWLSSAFYVSLPEPQPDDRPDAGALLLGVPEASLGLDHLSPRRIIKPKAGSLALFPSYLWHGTAPFAGPQPRITVAFDAAPA